MNRPNTSIIYSDCPPCTVIFNDVNIVCAFFTLGNKSIDSMLKLFLTLLRVVNIKQLIDGIFVF